MKLLDKKSCCTQWLSKRQLCENANIRLFNNSLQNICSIAQYEKENLWPDNLKNKLLLFITDVYIYDIKKAGEKMLMHVSS